MTRYVSLPDELLQTQDRACNLDSVQHATMCAVCHLTPQLDACGVAFLWTSGSLLTDNTDASMGPKPGGVEEAEQWEAMFSCSSWRDRASYSVCVSFEEFLSGGQLHRPQAFRLWLNQIYSSAPR